MNMKKINIKAAALTLLCAAVISSCKQDVLQTTPPTATTCTVCPPYSAGSADFTKFVVIGNSLAAGFQAGALFTEGQNNSLPKILSTQFANVGGGSFNQPDINSVNGYSSNPGVVLGRFVLFDPDGSGPRTPAPYPAGFPGSHVTCPSDVVTPALPAPYNTADAPTAFTGDKTKLNNFGVPGILLGQALIPDTGNPASPYYNGLWARFASQPGVKSILQDAIAANGTFFMVELGNNDVLGYAVNGASGSVGITPVGTFTTYYTQLIGALLASNTSSKGVVANIPDVTTIPYFHAVGWNAIKFSGTTDAEITALKAQIASINAGYVAYNQGIKNPAFQLSAAEITKRTIADFALGNNPIVITDETLTDLTSYGIPSIRQATSDDLITLTAGGILGTCVGNDPTKILGVTVGIDDKYVLIPSEQTEIRNAVTGFNNAIKSIVDANSTRVALADVNAVLTTLYTYKGGVYNGVTITPDFTPPTGAFSEDGVHPNSRGYAFLANVFISTINQAFSAKVPLVDISAYAGVGLPVNPAK